MAIRTALVCEAQVPFVDGGAERLVRQLVLHLRQHGCRAEIVSIPFKWYPKEEILAHAAAWRLIDLSESNGVPVDLVIATKFPTYLARHPHKVTWLVHQHRAAYELCGTPFSDFGYTELDVGLRESIFRIDRDALLESRRIFTIACNTSARLEKFLGVHADPLYHPPRLEPRLRPGPYGDYVLSVARIETIKRVDLAVEALALTRSSLRLAVVGEGTQEQAVAALAARRGVADRVDFLGAVDDDRLVDLYSGALAVVYAPYDEDYGYVTLEAFLSAKPVITAHDSGGVLEFVEDGVNGRICEPAADAIAAAMDQFDHDRARAASFGDAGLLRARQVTWHGVVERLLGEGAQDA